MDLVHRLILHNLGRAELLRLEGSIRGLQRTPLQPTTTPSQSPAPGTMLSNLSTDTQTDSAPVAQVSPRTTPTPPTPPRVSTTNSETPDETLDDMDATLEETDVTLEEIEMTLDDFDATPSSPGRASTESPLMSTESSSIPSRVCKPTPDLVPVTNRSPLQSQGAWTPDHHPSWTLGLQHRPYVHAAASYLVAVPGGADWEKLLVGYITFEGLSSDRSVSNLCTDLPVLADNVIGLIETPDQPTP